MPKHIKQRYKEQSKLDRNAQKPTGTNKTAAGYGTPEQGSSAQQQAGVTVESSSVLSWFGRLRSPSSGAGQPSSAADQLPAAEQPAAATATDSAVKDEASSVHEATAVPPPLPSSGAAPGALASAAGKLFSGWGRRLSSELSYGGATKKAAADS